VNALAHAKETALDPNKLQAEALISALRAAKSQQVTQ